MNPPWFARLEMVTATLLPFLGSPSIATLFLRSSLASCWGVFGPTCFVVRVTRIQFALVESERNAASERCVCSVDLNCTTASCGASQQWHLLCAPRVRRWVENWSNSSKCDASRVTPRRILSLCDWSGPALRRRPTRCLIQ